MGQGPSGMPGGDGFNKKKDDKKKEKPKYEPPVESKFGKKRRKGPDTAVKLPSVYPNTRCKLKLLKLERIKDHLLLEEEFVTNQEAFQPTEAKQAEEREKVDAVSYTHLDVYKRQLVHLFRITDALSFECPSYLMNM